MDKDNPIIFRSPTANKPAEQHSLYQASSPATPGLFATANATSTRTPGSATSEKYTGSASKISPPKSDSLIGASETQATPISSHSLISNALKRYEHSPQYRSSPLTQTLHSSELKMSPMQNRASPEVCAFLIIARILTKLI